MFISYISYFYRFFPFAIWNQVCSCGTLLRWWSLQHWPHTSENPQGALALPQGLCPAQSAPVPLKTGYDYNILWRWHHDKHDNTTCCDTLWYAIDRTPRTAEQKHTGRLLVLIHVIHDTFHVPSFNVATWYWRCLSETGSVWICKFTNHTNQCYRQSSVRLINPCESEADKLMYLINQPLRFMSFCWRMLNCVLQCLLFSNCRHCFW